MHRVVVMAVFLVVVMGLGIKGWAANDDGSQVKILSPEQGAVIKGDSVEVQYMLTKGAEGDTRTLKLTFDGVGATDVQTVECIISKTERKPERRTITKFIVTLRPTGAVT